MSTTLQTLRKHVGRGYGRIRQRFAAPLPTWFPQWLLMGIFLTGSVAFAITGLLGYPNGPISQANVVFSQPIVLFVWAGVLAIVLEMSIFRHPHDAAAQYTRPLPIGAVLSFSIVAIGVGCVVYLNSTVITNFLDLITAIAHTQKGKLIFTIIDALIMLAYWADVARRRHILKSAVRKITRRNETETAALQTSTEAIAGSAQVASSAPAESVQIESIYGDLFIASVLAAILALLFRTATLRGLFRLLQTSGFSPVSLVHDKITDCTVSWVYSTCSGPTHGQTFFTLTLINWVQAGVYFAIAIFILAGSLVLGIFKAPAPSKSGQESTSGAIEEKFSSEQSPSIEIKQAGFVLAVVAGVGDEAGQAVVRAIRWVLVPPCLVSAIYCVGVGAGAAQRYLQTLSCQHQRLFGAHPSACPSGYAFPLDFNLTNYKYIGIAALAVAIGWVLLTIATTLAMFNWRAQATISLRSLWLVTRHWLKAMVTIGRAVVFPATLVSIVYLIANVILNAVVRTPRMPLPFFPPDVLTYFGALYFLIVILLDSWKDTPKSEDPAAVGAIAGNQTG